MFHITSPLAIDVLFQKFSIIYLFLCSPRTITERFLVFYVFLRARGRKRTGGKRGREGRKRRGGKAGGGRGVHLNASFNSKQTHNLDQVRGVLRIHGDGEGEGRGEGHEGGESCLLRMYITWHLSILLCNTP